MHLRITTSFLLFTFLGLLVSETAQAQLSFRNRSNKTVYVAVAFRDQSCGGKHWAKFNWLQIPAGATESLNSHLSGARESALRSATQSGDIYYYGESADGQKWQGANPNHTLQFPNGTKDQNGTFQAICHVHSPSGAFREPPMIKATGNGTSALTIDIPAQGTSSPVSPGRTVRVKVWRHSSIRVTASEAQTILNRMSRHLKRRDIASDVSTAVNFVLDGPVQVLPPRVHHTVRNSRDFATLQSVGRGVKVVRNIEWCSSTGGSIYGCAPVTAAEIDMAVIRLPWNDEGVLWVHEYGHNAGLSHVSRFRAIMNAQHRDTNTAVNRFESQRYLGGPQASIQSLAAGRALNETLAKLDNVPIHGPTHQFVDEMFDEQDIAVLSSMLAHPTDDRYAKWLPQIAQILGYIGSDQSVDSLIDFVNSPIGGSYVAKAKNSALIHLGDIIRETQNARAIEFLEEVASDTLTNRRLGEIEARAAAAEAQAESTSEMLITPLSATDLSADFADAAKQGLDIGAGRVSPDNADPNSEYFFHTDLDAAAEHESHSHGHSHESSRVTPNSSSRPPGPRIFNSNGEIIN